MNIVDLVIVAMLVIAFFRGFSLGIWNRILSTLSSLSAMAASYFLTAPVVTFLEMRYHFMTWFSEIASSFFLFLPVHGKVYDPGELSLFLQGITGNKWLAPFQDILKKSFASSYAFMGQGATWDQVLGSILGKMIASSLVFMVLFAIFRMIVSMLTRAIVPQEAQGTVDRLLGGILEAGISFVWLSIVAGILYMFLGFESLGFLREAASSSVMMKPLLSVYQVFSTFVLSRLNLS